MEAVESSNMVLPEMSTSIVREQGRLQTRVLIYEPSSLPDIAAKWIIRALETAIRERGRCTLALAGGTSWGPTYRRMASAWLAERITWNKVAIYFGDERCVTPEDSRSNYGSAIRTFLARPPIANAAIHRIPADAADPDEAARSYASQLPEHLDVLLLGVGIDGHTASLFPHSPAIAEDVRRVVTVKRPSPDVGRITITCPVIDAARTVFVLAGGSQKSAAVARALEGPWTPDELPVQLTRNATWLIDSRAARCLHGKYERRE